MTQLIETIYGPMEAKSLRRVEAVKDDARERTVEVEYYLAGQCVHRSVHVQLKQPVRLFADTAKL